MINKGIKRILLIVLILNITLISIPYNITFATEIKDSNVFKVDEGIKGILTYEDKILIINKSGQATIKSDKEEVNIDGEGFRVISNRLIINDENRIFDFYSEKFLDYETSQKYIDEINEMSEIYNYKKIYFYDDKFMIVSNNSDLYSITTIINEDNTYIEKEKVENIEATDISIDKNGIVYINNNGKLYTYKGQEFQNIYDKLDNYKISVYDSDNIIIYNESEYIKLNLNEKNIEQDVKDEENNILNSSESLLENNGENINSQIETVNYQTHIQNEGWQEWKSNGETSGTEGKSYRLEGIKISINKLPEGSSISYRTHIQDIGWQQWKYNGEMSGTEGQAKRLEGIEIKLLNAPKGYHVEYRVHVQEYGWQNWVRDGEMAGTEGQSKRLEAIEIRIVKDTSVEEKLSYQSLAINEDWSTNSNQGEISGLLINPLKAIKINYTGLESNITIQYRAHVQNEGWHNWVENGQVAGSENSDNLLEAVEIKLVNAPSNYHILYRVNVSEYGWQGWKKDGQEAGTTGLSGQIIGVQIKLFKDASEPTIKYSTHVQNQGWQNYKANGEMSGAEGKALRLEGIKINLENLDNNSIIYRTHIQNIGWQNWVSDGMLSGTEGKSLRLEAIQLKLKEDIPGYKLYYRVHVQDYGWQEWKANGEVAGTLGESKRLEAIEIKLVKENYKSIVIDAGHNYGGDDGAYSTHNGITYCERDLNMSVASKLKRELEVRGYEVIMTRSTEDRETIAMRDSLKKRVNIANYLNADFFISIHQNSASVSSANGVEVYYSTSTPLTGGRLLRTGVEENLVQRRSYVESDKVNKSKEISSDLAKSISSKMGRNNRGAIDRDFYVVKNTRMPSVLLECGFISNSSEAKKLADNNLQQNMAIIIADEIAKYI